MGKKKESSVLWMIAKPFIALCIPLLVSASIMFSMSGGSVSDLLGGFSMPSIEAFNKEGGMSLNVPTANQQVYKWKDKDGVWHFSESAPTDNQAKQLEKFTVNSQITTIQMPKPEVEEVEKKPVGSQGFVISAEKKSSDEELGELASDPIQLLNQAKAVAEKMKQRNTTLEGM